MTDEVIIRISLAALSRWQPERSEVSLYIICIMAYKVSLYFIDGFKSLLSWRAIQICSTNEESTILDYSIFKEQIKNPLIFTLYEIEEIIF